MGAYTYFVIAPGYQPFSYVQYANDVKGNYIKFGDQDAVKKPAHAGLRAAYLTHNPDIGVAAIMNSNVFTGPYLGTRLKNYIADIIKIEPVGHTEWFSVQAKASWALFVRMQHWDDKTLDLGDEMKIKKAINDCLK